VKSFKATAESQGLAVEDSVQVRAIPLDTIKKLVYGGNTYKVIPEPVGGVSAEQSEDQSEDATQNA